MPFPIDVSRCLAFAATEAPLEICSIPSERLRARLGVEGLHEGDVIRTQRDAKGRTFVTTAGGTRVAVEQRHAVMIEVSQSTRAWETAASEAVRLIGPWVVAV